MTRLSPTGIFSAIALAATLSACATTSSMDRTTRNDLDRASVGTVGVVSIARAPNINFADLGFFGGAAKGASDWLGFFSSGNGGVAAGGAFFFPVAGLVGGIQAAGKGLSSDSKNEIEAILRKGLPERDAQNRWREHVRTRAAVWVKEGVLDLGSANAIANRNVTTMLEVGLQQLVVTSGDEKDPQVKIQIVASARLLRASDRRVLWISQFTKDIGSRKLSEFHDEAANLAGDIDGTLDRLAIDVVDVAFASGIGATELAAPSPDPDCSEP